jgi:large subunit ribosomal protein L22
MEQKLKKSVRIRLQKEALAQYKETNAGQLGAVMAHLRNVPTSPRKMRLVADLVRGMRVENALNVLRFESKIGAKYIESLLVSAINNWKNQNENLDETEARLFVKEIFVNEGRMLKRLRPAPQGRGHRIRKRSNHITLVVDSLNAISDNNNN